VSAQKLFYLLKDAELRAGELYALIGLSVSVAHPALSDLFNELAEEETLHARQIELLQGMAQGNDDLFSEHPDAEAQLQDFMQNLAMMHGHFQQHHAQMKPMDLVHLALDLERHLVERHGALFIASRDPQVKALFQSLNLGDAAHIRKLESFSLD
jgi:rubrerythrin